MAFSKSAIIAAVPEGDVLVAPISLNLDIHGLAPLGVHPDEVSPLVHDDGAGSRDARSAGPDKDVAVVARRVGLEDVGPRGGGAEGLVP